MSVPHMMPGLTVCTRSITLQIHMPIQKSLQCHDRMTMKQTNPLFPLALSRFWLAWFLRSRGSFLVITAILCMFLGSIEWEKGEGGSRWPRRNKSILRYYTSEIRQLCTKDADPWIDSCHLNPTVSWSPLPSSQF